MHQQLIAEIMLIWIHFDHQKTSILISQPFIANKISYMFHGAILAQHA